MSRPTEIMFVASATSTRPFSEKASAKRSRVRATGVRPWFKPFDVEYEFTYVGIGKKGGY
jgi:uncharacterized protein involved in high-affinity Fe2+ transport